MTEFTNKLFNLIDEACKKDKDDKKVVLGKNKSRIIINPGIKEGVNAKEFSVVERVRAATNPEGVIADPKASSALKDYANAILQLRLGNT